MIAKGKRIDVSSRDDFIMQTYQILCAKNDKSQDHRWSFMQLSLLGIFAFYAGLFSDKLAISPMNRNILLFFPAVLSALGLLQAWGLRLGNHHRGQLMRRIEQHFDFAGIQLDRDDRQKFYRNPLTYATYAFWSLMLASTLAIALFVVFKNKF
jgi:ammonia channel protein AmtB